MSASKTVQSRNFRPWRPALFLLLTVAFVTNFFYSFRWGLYEDDYIWVMTLRPLNYTPGDALGEMVSIWRQWVTFQCRPLGFSFNVLLGCIGSIFPTLHASYLIGATMSLLNTALVFHLTRAKFGMSFALLAAIAFFAFPADASEQILMHRHVQLATSFLLLAVLAFSRERTVLAYSIASLILITYEAPFLAFVVAPFFARQPVTWRSVVRHGIIFCALAVAMLTVRSLAGDGRAQLISGGLIGVAGRMIEAALIGLGSTLFVSIKTPFAVLSQLSSVPWLPAGLVLILLTVAFVLVFRRIGENRNEPALNLGREFFSLAFFVAAVAFTYVLSFRPEYFPPRTVVGRLSAVNVGATLPFALLVAQIFRIVTLRMSSAARVVVTAGLFFLVSGWCLYAIKIQEDEYCRSWENNQKPFWHLVISHAQDFEAGVPILADMDSFPQTAGFSTHGFVGTKAFDGLEGFVQFPANAGAPHIYGISAKTEYSPTPEGIMIHSPEWNPDLWPDVKENGFYRVIYANNSFIFSDDPIRVGGIVMHPRPLTAHSERKPLELRRAGKMVFGSLPR